MTTTELPDDLPAVHRLAGVVPEDFVWGVATAAYQIEGGVDEGGRGPSIWDTFSHRPGAVINGDTGDIACDHFHRWPEDLELLSSLGVDAYRLSIAWPRMQADGTGPLSAEGVDFYRTLLERLRELEIRPFITLYHWDLPQALEDAGGWPARETAHRFAEYAGLVVAALGDLATNWLTLNEPYVSAFLGYHTGVHAPGRRDARTAVRAAHHLLLGHGLATQHIREARGDASVGIALNLGDVLPASPSAEDEAAAHRADCATNRLFLEPLFHGAYGDDVLEVFADYGLADAVRDGDPDVIAEPLDFLGINHYHQVVVAADPDDDFLGLTQEQMEPATTNLGWSVRPESLRNVLERVTREFTPLPLYVTENGACYEDYTDPDGNVKDYDRVVYLDGYITAAMEALNAGANLAGYFVWSLLDNFEWAEGYRKRFGIVFVDYRTQDRIPKTSFTWYRDVIAMSRKEQ